LTRKKKMFFNNSVCWEGPSLDTILQARDHTAAEKRREEHMLEQRQHLLEEHLDVQCIENL
jgi:hypothetical protein